MTDSTRPPNKPPTNPPPSGPPPSSPPKSQATDDLMHLADSLGFQSPARQGSLPAAVAAAVGFRQSPGGPVKPPVAAGKEPTPGSAVATSSAACESERAGTSLAGASSGRAGAATPSWPDAPGLVPGCKGRVGGAPGAATFSLPPIPTVPSFDNGPRTP